MYLIFTTTESVEIFSAQYFPHERDCPPSFGAGENPGVAREVNGTAASVSQFGNVDGTSDRARTTPSSRTTWHLTSPFSFSTHWPILHPFFFFYLVIINPCDTAQTAKFKINWIFTCLAFSERNASPMNDGMSESARVYEDGGFGDRPAGWTHQRGQSCLQAWICPLQGYRHY